ncbi:MAG: hypothetical protein AMS14_10335 [Planctomycetes bacterium DG_20]|nr:MAG: hypothetical protein AMS14_10335 [Planctomycetes bacterium DG_20]
MTLLRRHLAGIILFPLTVLFVSLPLLVAFVLHAESPSIPPAAVLTLPLVTSSLLALLLGVCLYRRDAGAQAEWSALAPALAAAFVLALHWRCIIANLLWGPRGLLSSPGTLGPAVLGGVWAVGIALVCGAAACIWMAKAPRDGRAAGLGREAATAALLTVLCPWPRLLGLEVTQALGWGFGPTFETTFTDTHLRLAAESGFALGGILVPSLLVVVLFWRRADLGGRLRALAVVSVWILVDHWLNQLYRYVVGIERYNWAQALVFGAIASAVALAYAHLVVVPLWRRARRRSAAERTASPEPESGRRV